MLAYLFWHWPLAAADPAEYETRLAEFHARLRSFPPERFLSSTSARITGARWTPNTAVHQNYEDWYLVEDFAALGLLNEAAVSEARKNPHDLVANLAGGGNAGLYALVSGDVLAEPPATNLWFAKPSGTSHAHFHSALDEALSTTPHTLWQRQMVFGPAPEYCLQADEFPPLPTILHPTHVVTEPIFY
jgi:hypothetical protein